MLRLIFTAFLLFSCTHDAININKYRIRYVFYCGEALQDIYISTPYANCQDALNHANEITNIPSSFCNCDSVRIYVNHATKDSLIQTLICLD